MRKSVQKFLDEKYGHLSPKERRLAEEILEGYSSQLPQQIARLITFALVGLLLAALLVVGFGLLVRLWAWAF